MHTCVSLTGRRKVIVDGLTITLRNSLCYDQVRSTPRKISEIHMSYTVQQLADIAGITVRTLHHYDRIGLLKPARVESNGYRYYEEKELLQLQQILFFKELDFSLEAIKKIIHAPHFDMRGALRDQRRLIELKRKRLNRLIQTIDKTLKKLNQEINMNDTDLYGSFTKDELDRYTEEARQRWGNTEAFVQAQERIKKMGKEGLDKVTKESRALTQKIAEAMRSGKSAESDEVQILVQQHYNGLRAFYEPTLELYRGLAGMYVEDHRFKQSYDDVAKGLAQFMHDAMMYYVDTKEAAQ